MVSTALHRAFVAFVALIMVGGILPGTAAQATSPVAPIPVVQGNRLVDTRTATVFVPHGVNWPSFEYACWQGWGYSTGNSAAEATAMASWGINAVRLPLNQDCWLGLQGSPAYGTVTGYRAAVHSWVDTLNAAGLVVILDLHTSAPAGYPAHGQRAMPDAQSVTFWHSVATEFAATPSVLFDLFNEPYSRWNDATNSWTFQLTWDCWAAGGCTAPVEDDYTAALSGSTYPVTGMTALVEAVRSAGAGQPIMLGGIDYSNDLRGWLAHAPDDSQLVASWHNYPGQRCHTVECWNSEIMPVAAVVPVVTGEFGQTDGGNSYLTGFMDWADGHGVGYLPWAWWKVSASESVINSRYALVEGSGFTPKAPSGTAFHDHLAGLAPPSPALVVDRLAGDDRYETAIAVTSLSAPDVDVVYVANGSDFPDALSAAPAAAALGGALLLTPSSALPSAVKAELVRLHPTTIVVVGGKAAISDGVFAELSTLAPTVRRDDGTDRYQTSETIARRAFPTGAETAFIATGRGFPDALSAAAAAGALAAPVILVDGNANALGAATAQLLVDLGIETVTIVGGSGVVTTGIEAGLRSLLGVGSVRRLGGADRYTTSVAVGRAVFDRSPTVYLATGLGFADALTGAALAGSTDSALYLVPGRCVPPAVLDDITALETSRVTLIGGTGVLTASVFSLTPC